MDPILEEGEISPSIKDESSSTAPTSPTATNEIKNVKKRSYDEAMNSEKLKFFQVLDYDNRNQIEKIRTFYSVGDLNKFMNRSDSSKSHLSSDFVTKRYMYYRIDSVRDDTSNRYKKQIQDLDYKEKNTFKEYKLAKNLNQIYEKEIGSLRHENNNLTEKNLQLLVEYQKLQAQYNELFLSFSTYKPVVDQILQNSLALGYNFQ
jgi:hypothetical protein